MGGVQAHDNMCRRRFVDALMKTTEGTERVERTNAVGRDKKTSLTWTRWPLQDINKRKWRCADGWRAARRAG